MDIEQLKLVLDLLRDLGSNGQTAVIWWLVLDNVMPIIGLLSGLGMVVWGATTIIRAANTSTTLLLGRWRDQLRIGAPGMLYPSERAEVISRIDSLINTSRSGK